MPTASLPRGASPLSLEAIFPDASVPINRMIANAIENGLEVVTLPNGTCYLDNPITIPKGTANLTIQGHSLGTILKARDQLSGVALLQVGQDGNNPNLVWGGGGLLLTQDVQVGDTILKKSAITGPPTVGEYYAIADLATIPEWQGTSFEDVEYRAELVKVTAYVSLTGTITIDRPAAREYLAGSPDNARIFPVQTENNDVCVNITLRDFTVDGQWFEGDELYVGDGIWCVLCDGITISNVTVTHCDGNCIRFDLCRNVTVEDVLVSGEAERDTLYRGVNFFRCRDIACKSISADKLRHGIQFSTANSDFSLVGYTATNSLDDSPDCHGGKNHRGLIADFTTDKSCKVGNVSYPTGDQDITIQNGVCTEGIRVQGGSRVTVANCTAQAALFATIKGQVDSVPNNCSFTNCFLSVPASPDPPFSTVNFGCTQFDYNDEYPISGSQVRNFNWVSFNNCSFEMFFVEDPSFNVFIEDLIGDAQVTFNDCEFRSLRVENEQIRVYDSASQWDGLLSLDFWSCSMESGTTQTEGNDHAASFSGLTASDVETILSGCQFINFDSPTTICVLGSGAVSDLIDRDNSPDAW